MSSLNKYASIIETSQSIAIFSPILFVKACYVSYCHYLIVTLMMVPSIVLLLLCMLSLVALIWSAFECEKYDSNMGATFDLTDMRR